MYVRRRLFICMFVLTHKKELMRKEIGRLVLLISPLSVTFSRIKKENLPLEETFEAHSNRVIKVVVKELPVNDKSHCYENIFVPLEVFLFLLHLNVKDKQTNFNIKQIT